ncbi:hypothetical protein Tco_0713656 [Tanacetum coccineum]
MSCGIAPILLHDISFKEVDNICRVAWGREGTKGINIDFAKLILDDIILKLKKKNREKFIPYPRFLSLLLELRMEGYGTNNVTSIPTHIFSVNNLILKKGQPEGPPFIDHMLAICKAETPVAFKAPRTSSHTEKKDSQGKKSGAKSRHKKQSSLKHTSVSIIEATKVSTHVDLGMHKEDQQATGDPTSLEFTSEDGANPQLSSGYDASADSTAKTDLGKSAPNDYLPTQQGKDEGTKSYSLDHTFADLDSPEDDPIIVVDESKGDYEVDKDEGIHSTLNVETENASASKPLISQHEKNKAEAEVNLLTAQPSFPNMGQLNEPLVKSLHTKFSKILSSRDFSSSLPTKRKELPTKFNELVEVVKGLKNQVHELEIELLGEWKEIPTKLEDFTKTVTSLTSQVAETSQVVELKTLQWELPVEFLPLPTQLFQRRAGKNAKKTNRANRPEYTTQNYNTNHSSNHPNHHSQTIPLPPKSTKSSFQPEGEQAMEDKGKKAMSSKDNKEESTKSNSDDENTSHVAGSLAESSKKKKLRKFDFVTEGGDHVHLTKEQINAQKKIEEEAKAEAAKQEGEVRREELVDLLGLEVVSKYYNAKLQYDKYCDKMLNKRAKSRITNYDVLTRKGPITLKVYKEDDTSKIIPDFKASDLYLGE